MCLALSSSIMLRSAQLHRKASVPPVEVWLSPFPPQLHDLLRGQALRVGAGEVDAETVVSSLFETVESDPGRWPNDSKGSP